VFSLSEALKLLTIGDQSLALAGLNNLKRNHKDDILAPARAKQQSQIYVGSLSSQKVHGKY
jgi:hypothetical protein